MYIKHLTHGKAVTLQPFSGVEKTLRVKTLIYRSNDDLPDIFGIKRIQVPMLDDDSTRKKAFNLIMALDDDFEECWHASYVDGDNGNFWDQEGSVSAVIENFRRMLGWPIKNASLDKILVSKKNHFGLDAFHTDHFCGTGKFVRSQGYADRAILNIGCGSRWLAFLVSRNTRVNKYIGDDYEKDAYAELARSLEDPKLLLVESAAYGNKNSCHGLLFDAFLTVHCSYCKQYSVAAVLTRWREL